MRRALAPLAALVALAACAPHVARPACPAGQKCLLVGNVAEPGTIDPAMATATPEIDVVNDLMVGLVQNGADSRPVPALATSWETSPDGLVWTFHLRDAQWSDGSPVTADDFVFGMRRVLDPKTASEYASLLYLIRNAEAVNDGKAPLGALGVHAVDARTLRIELTHPAPYFLELAKHNVMMPQPRKAVERWGAAWVAPGRYLSTGPYVLKEWRQNDHITVVKNPRFYDAAKVCMDQVVFYPTTDYLSAERRIRRGELDTSGRITPSRIPLLREPGQIPAYVHIGVDLVTEYLAFNPRTVPAFRDARVRQALTMAIDRDFISRDLLRGIWPAANAFVSPGTANYPRGIGPYWADWPQARRQAEARRLLAEAGYGPAHPLHVELKVRGLTDNNMVMPAVVGDWRDIGVKADIARMEPEVAYADYRAGNFQIAEANWGADYNDAMSFLGQWKSNTGPMNYADYKNPAYDALLAKADAETDIARRAGYLTAAERLMLNDAAIAPIYYFVSNNLVNPRVTGWVENVMNYHPSRYLCFRTR